MNHHRTRNTDIRVAPNQLLVVKEVSISKTQDVVSPNGVEAVRLSRNLRRMKRRLLLSLADEQELKYNGGSSQDLSAQESLDKSIRTMSEQDSFESRDSDSTRKGENPR